MLKKSLALGALAIASLISAPSTVHATPTLISTQDSISIGVPPLLAHLVEAAGVPVIDGSNYPERCGPALGIYNTHYNVMVMCTQNIPNAAMYVETFAHEAVHLAQDCRIGLDNDALYAGEKDYTQELYADLPEFKQENLHGNYEDEVFAFEVEAFYFEDYPDKVAKGVADSCF